MRNSFTQVYPNSDVSLISNDIYLDFIDKLINQELDTCSSNVSPTESEKKFERVVKEIRSGSDVKIYSPN